MLFQYANGCYLIVPKHAVEGMTRVRVLTGDPVIDGKATIHRPFWDGLDLAVGIVRRIPAERCGDSLTELQNTQSGIATDEYGHLTLLRKSGQVDRPRVRVRKTDYLTLEASLDDSKFSRVVQQGFSGAMLFVGQKPVAMAIERIDDRTARFVRVEEIAMNIGRWLNSRGQSLTPLEPQPEQNTDRLGFSVLAASNVGAGNDTLVENLIEPAGFYEFEQRLPATVTLSIDNPNASLRRVLLNSESSDQHAMPKNISVFTDSRADGEASWIRFANGVMDRDGRFDSGYLNQRFARRIQIVIRSAWSAGNVRIDRVLLE